MQNRNGGVFMVFWAFMLLVNTLTPFTMIGFGKLFLNHASGEINTAFGYCTRMSMKNRDTWEFAHQYCGRLWFFCGLILLPLSILPMFFVMGENEDVVGGLVGVICMIQCGILIGTIIPTELALRKNFDKNGMRR